MAWRYRFPQVGTFAAVAELRRFLGHDPAWDFPALAAQWSRLEPLQVSRYRNARGMITYHPWYDGFRAEAANRCLAETAELGAGYIRLDVRWKDLLPDGHNVDEAAWSWYRQYLEAARNWYGLEPLIVLFNPPDVVRNYPVKERLATWTQYVDDVAKRSQSLCSLFQLLNEPNNPVYRVFSLREISEAIVSGAEAIKRYNAQAKVTINVLAGLPGWERDLEVLVGTSGSSIDIIGLDYYPGTWTLSPLSDGANWDLFAERMTDICGALRNRPIAILETGYSTNVPLQRGEKQQVRYLRRLQDAIKRWDERMALTSPVLLGIHELSDADTGVFLDPEAHFGLLKSGSLRRKAGFEAARALFQSLEPKIADKAGAPVRSAFPQ